MVDPESNMDRMSIRANYWMTLSAQRHPTGSSVCSKLEVGETEHEAEISIVEEVEKLQDISNPDTVRKIGFVGQLGLSGYQPLECIISPCKNITSLFLHMSVFCISKQNSSMQSGPWLASCCLPHLKELVIDSCGISCDDSSNTFNFKCTFLSLAAFLYSQKFIRLETIIIAIPYMEYMEGILTRAICVFLGKHSDSIKKFAYTQKYEIPNDEDSENENEDETERQHQGDGDRFDNIKRSFNFSTDVNYLSLSQLALSTKELKTVCLEELYVVLNRKQESAPVWKNLLIKQDHMKKCVFTGDKIPLPQGTIEMNHQSLAIVRLDIRDGVNLECFKTCVHLRELSLGGRRDANESYGSNQSNEGDDDASLNDSQLYQHSVQLKNAIYLPSSLESLEIINLWTHKNDLRTIALELPSLQDLTLKNVGWEGNLGLRLCDLAKIYERGKLNHLCIKASLNLMSYSELEEESLSPELNLIACVVQSNSFAAASKFSLEVWKRSGDLYTTRKPEGFAEVEEDELDVFQMPNKVELNEEEDQESNSSSSEEEEDEGSNATTTGDDEKEVGTDESDGSNSEEAEDED